MAQVTQAVGDACKVLDALAQFQYDVIRRVNRKFNALRRLAETLELLGDLAGLIPNLPALLPLASINLDMYERLQVNCPFLNLPPVGNSSVAELQARVRAAYANLTKGLLNHPFLRMDKLQDNLSKFQQEVNLTLATGADYIKCLQTVCETVKSATSAIEGISSAAIQKEISAYTKNFVNQAGNVLTQPMQQKVGQVNSALGQMQELGVDVGQDYHDASAAIRNA